MGLLLSHCIHAVNWVTTIRSLFEHILENWTQDDATNLELQVGVIDSFQDNDIIDYHGFESGFKFHTAHEYPSALTNT